MNLPEAHKIARHHLGDRLHWIGRGGPHADLWIVQAWPDKGHMVSVQGATVDAAAADCASQLRASGWVPTHARLEWIREYDDFTLRLTAGKVWTDLCYIGPASCMGQKHREVKSAPGVLPKLDCDYMHLPEAVAYISAWVAENIPYHLPPFPGAAQ